MDELEEKSCWLCGRNGYADPLERHHIFGGSNRKWSEKYGLVVWLCGERCHRNGAYAVHRNKTTATLLHMYGQQKWMKEQHKSIQDFIELFGRNYL